MENMDSRPYSISDQIRLFMAVLLKTAGIIFLGIGITALIFRSLGFDITLRDPEAFPGLQHFLLYAQGVNTTITFILIPVLYIFYFKRDLIPIFGTDTPALGKFLLLAFLLIFTIMPSIVVVVEWNKGLSLPESLSGLEDLIRHLESETEKMVNLIIYYDTPLEFLLILIVIAVLPAIGEELLFRGIIQNELRQIFSGPHAAIWITGFLFSFIHMQFFGFFPRMLLGVVFGYLYYWSGNLLVPVFVHFINNALTFIAMNMHRQGKLAFDLEAPGAVTPAGFIVSVLLSGFIMFILVKEFKAGKVIRE